MEASDEDELLDVLKDTRAADKLADEGACRRGKFKSRHHMPYYERRATAMRLREIARYIEASDDERAVSSPWPVYGPCF